MAIYKKVLCAHIKEIKTLLFFVMPFIFKQLRPLNVSFICRHRVTVWQTYNFETGRVQLDLHVCIFLSGMIMFQYVEVFCLSVRHKKPHELITKHKNMILNMCVYKTSIHHIYALWFNLKCNLDQCQTLISWC